MSHLEKPAQKAATLADVAREVGVSTMTVSNVLSGRYKTSAHREAIMEAVERLNFRPDPHAQRLASGFSQRTIALFSLALDLGVATMKMHAIQMRLSALGYDVPLHVHDLNGGTESSGQTRLVRELCRQRPRAIVICDESLCPDVVEELYAYQQSGGFVVAYDHGTELNCDRVIFDRQTNSYWATKALLEKGHRSLGFANHGNTINHVRFNGFAAALEEYGLRPRPEWLFHGPYNYEKWGARLAEEFLNLSERPTGMVIVNDSSASAFIQSLMRQGWNVPEAVSVVGHDDIPAGQFCIVPVTTASHPVKEIAESVVTLLTDRLTSGYDGAPRTITHTGELVVRDSLSAPSLLATSPGNGQS